LDILLKYKKRLKFLNKRLDLVSNYYSTNGVIVIESGVSYHISGVSC